MPPILACRNLSVRYDGKPVVTGVGFDLEAGDFLCVLGENGSGKTTLMKAVLGIIRPAGGEVTWNAAERGGIGYMPQQTETQKDFPASVGEAVLSGRLGRRGRIPFYSKDDRNIALKYMERLGAADLMKTPYRELSGGQRQRVLLARALCAAERALFLDEPASGLDPAGAASMYGFLSSLNRERKVAVMMITHDVDGALRYGNKILHLRNSPVYCGPANKYISTYKEGSSG